LARSELHLKRRKAHDNENPLALGNVSGQPGRTGHFHAKIKDRGFEGFDPDGTAGLDDLLLLGKRLGSVFGKRMGVAGGLVLIGIGVKILLDHVVAR